MFSFKNNFKNSYVKFSIVAGLLFLGGLIMFDNLSNMEDENNTNLSSIETQELKVDNYTKVQKIFNARCIACHACYESPCQLNLQSFAGLQRGVLKIDIFNRYRINEIPPTRLYEDGSTLEDWKNLGFHDVIGNSTSSVLLNAVVKGSNSNRQELPNNYPEERQCINHDTENLITQLTNPHLAMPYNLPGLSETEVATIKAWVNEGAIPPKNDMVVTDTYALSVIKPWVDFLNSTPDGQKYKYKLTSRYMYEHLNLAHLYIKDEIYNKNQQRQFYSLIRSKTSCESPTMISTRTPGNDPGVENFYYCIVKFSGTIVNKNHLPYEISLKKLNWIKKLFIDTPWDNEKDSTPLPPYQVSGDKLKAIGIDTSQIDFDNLMIKKGKVTIDNLLKDFKHLKQEWEDVLKARKNEKVQIENYIKQNKIASNPFVIYKDIPQESRYRFLLEDSYYHIMTFMKGTSCNGTMAVNAVQDHFYLLFLAPNVNQQLNTWDVLKEHNFPGRYGRETGIGVVKSYLNQATDRNKARAQLNSNLKKYYENGLPINVIWDGDKSQSNNEMVLTSPNPNAMLTIFRHNDSASVVRGPVGDLTKTVMLMDYATFERMAYDLVINFDAFGSLGHMILTRSYMGLIRTDAENMYLSLLPPTERIKLKKNWYNDSETKSDLEKLEEDTLTIMIRSLLQKAGLTEHQQALLYKESQITDIKQNAIEFNSSYSNPEEAHLGLMKKIIFKYLGREIIGEGDPMNWQKLQKDKEDFSIKSKIKSESSMKIEAALAGLTREVKDVKVPFLYYFPEMSILVLGNGIDGKKEYKKFYSLILNRQFNSISLMAGEDYHRLPEKETLTLSSKMIGYYPNQFFYVNNSPEDVNIFVKAALNIKSKDDYENFLDTYGVQRMNPEIWKIYDFIVDKYHKLEPIDAGYLDLSRYNYSN